jgi:hypothetical protein
MFQKYFIVGKSVRKVEEKREQFGKETCMSLRASNLQGGVGQGG